MRPLVRSYGLSSIRTLSPTNILTKFLRIFPEIVASTGSCVSGAPSMAHRNMAFGKLSSTTASTSMTSSFCFLTRSVLFFRSFPCSLAAFLPKSVSARRGQLLLAAVDVVVVWWCEVVVVEVARKNKAVGCVKPLVPAKRQARRRQTSFDTAMACVLLGFVWKDRWSM